MKHSVVLTTPLLAGCGGGDSGNGGGSPTGTSTETADGGNGALTATPEEADAVISVFGLNVDPKRVSIDVGQVVEWDNKDTYNGHELTSASFSDAATSWEFSDSMDVGESLYYRFESAGIYQFYCETHGEGRECGVIMVGDVSFDGTLPCARETDSPTASDSS